MDKNFSKGSEWRKWDLHAHTPLDYDWQDDDILTNDNDKKNFAIKYIDFAKSQNISAIAITDHNFCNNIEDSLIPYIQEEANKNNIVVFPGFEITAKDGSGIHILVIFPENTNLQTILDIVKKCFPAGTILQSEQPPVSDKSISEIKEIINAAKLESILIYAHADRENGVLFQGTIRGQRRIDEWHNPYVDMVQMSKRKSEITGFYKNIFIDKDPTYYRKIAYIMASDCRTLNVNNSSDRYYLGEKFSWIKADLSFKGLQQAIVECEDRICSENYPENMEQINSNKTKYIDKISISSEEPSEHWFNQEIVLNSGLVSIIGNKGSGKSALADIIGLLGNSKNTEYFSFLNKDKFYKDNSSDKHFAKIKWLSDENYTDSIPLKKSFDDSAIEKVRYIPQSYFEKVCNLIDNQKDFKKEIEKVIFKHLSDEEKQGTTDFDSLIKLKKEVGKNDIERYVTQLREKIDTYVSISDELLNQNILLNKSYLDDLSKQKLLLDANLAALNKNRIEKPVDSDITALSNIMDEINKEDLKLKGLQKSEYNILQKLDNLDSIEINIQSFKITYEDIKERLFEQFNSLDLKIEDILTLTINETTISNKKKELDLIKSKIEKQIQDTVNNIKSLDSKKETQEQLLTQESKNYQDYLQTKTNYEKQLNELLGDKDAPLSKVDTYYYYEHICSEEYINNLKLQKDNLFKEIIGLSIKIFEVFLSIRKIYEHLKENVDSFIKNFNFSPESNIKIEFKPNIKILKEAFISNIMLYIDKQGAFRGEERDKLFENICNLELNTSEDFSHMLISLIKTIKQNNDNKEDTINKSLKKDAKASDLYEYIFSAKYLEVDYDLEFNNKPISMLSPGERGLLLLTFFLLADTSSNPLILDQPEDNLDNQTIYNVLVQLIKNAKKKRQVIIVTHNPNLAVVCDSDQIICANFDSSKDPKIEYLSGSIENPDINERIVNILEGTMPAFKNRDKKYIITRK